MIIKVNLEVPDGLYCNGDSNVCRHYENVEDVAGHCNLFFEYLLFRDQYSTVAVKHKKCIEAQVEKKISLADCAQSATKPTKDILDKIRHAIVLNDQIPSDESKLQEEIERLQKALADKDDQIAQTLIFTDMLMEKKNAEIEEIRKNLDDVTCSLIFANKTIERKNVEIELLKLNC